MSGNKFFFLIIAGLILVSAIIVISITGNEEDSAKRSDIPEGYEQVIEFDRNGKTLFFGPFMGYYFKVSKNNASEAKFLCYNEKQFYTDNLPENTLIFKGEAKLTTLLPVDFKIPSGSRINPVFFKDAPETWKDSRPEPKDQFLHFHSCYTNSGPSLTGFWIKHYAMEDFTYNMGGRVNSKSPLYHQVTKGIDKDFARIIEFDFGPNFSNW